MTNAITVNVKELKAAIKILNDSKLFKPNLKTVGVKSEVMVEEFVDMVEALYKDEATKEKVSKMKSVKDLYNSLVDQLDNIGSDDGKEPDKDIVIDTMQITDVCKMQVKQEIDACIERGMSRNKAAKWLADVLSEELGKDIKPETVRQKDKRARGLAKTSKKKVGTTVPTISDAISSGEKVGTTVPTISDGIDNIEKIFVLIDNLEIELNNLKTIKGGEITKKLKGLNKLIDKILKKGKK